MPAIRKRPAPIPTIRIGDPEPNVIDRCAHLTGGGIEAAAVPSIDDHAVDPIPDIIDRTGIGVSRMNHRRAVIEYENLLALGIDGFAVAEVVPALAANPVITESRVIESGFPLENIADTVIYARGMRRGIRREPAAAETIFIRHIPYLAGRRIPARAVPIGIVQAVPNRIANRIHPREVIRRFAP